MLKEVGFNQEGWEKQVDETIFVRSLDQQLCFEVYKAANGFSKMYGRALKPFGLTFPQYLVLLALFDEDGVGNKNISERVGMSIGTLNPILTRLANQGWVKRETSTKDKRAVIITLTEQSHDAKKDISKAILKEIMHCDMTDIANEAFFKGLKALNREFERLEQESK